MNTLSIPPLIMASITLYLGAFHLLIYSRQRQERQHLTFTLTCGVMALYDVFSAGLYNVTSATQGVHWQRAQVATLALLSITFPWFVVDYFARVSPLSSRAKRWIGASSVYFALAAVVGMLDRSGLVRPLDRPAVKEIQLLWGPRITYYEMEPGPLTNLQSLMGLALFVYILWLSVGIYRKGHREARPLLGALILFFGAAVNDTAVASGLYPFVYVMEYAYMGMVLLMTYALTGAVVETAVTKEALRESEERYRNIFQTAAVSIWEEDFTAVKMAIDDLKAQGVTDLEHYLDEHPEFVLQAAQMVKVLDINDATLKMFGAASKEELLGSLEKVVVPETLDIISEEIVAIAEGQIFLEGETVNQTLQGERLDILLTMTIPTETQKLNSVLVSMMDITERRQAEDALRESEAKFRNIIESSPMGMHMYQLEPDGRLVFTGANPAADKILSVDNSQFVGKTIEEAFPPLAETEVPERYRRSAATGQSWQTSQITYQDNQIAGAFEVYAFQTSPGKMAAMFLDVTGRKRTEAEVLRLQHLLQNITDSMPSTLITLDPTGRVLTWNPAAETLTGRTIDQVQGQLLWETCPELVRYRDMFERAVNGDPVVHLHKEQWATQAGTTYHDVSAFPLEANEIEGVVLRIDDVTQRVQLEEMMLQSAKMASVGGLAAGIAHEINNPLGAIMQSTQMLQMGLDTQRPRTRERLQECGVDPEGLDGYLRERGLLAYLDGIRDTGRRATKIVSDLLSFSRKSSSKTAPRNLNQLVQQTLDLAVADYDLTKKYDFRDIEVVYDLDPGLPNIICDGQQIQQVVMNLVRNAAQAMAEEIEKGNRDWQPRLTLRTSFQIENRKSKIPNRVRLEVEDNGPGIPEAVRERLFEPFFTTKDVGKGMGLGLWLCWSIVVERHGGSIEVESTMGRGSTFTVSLPVAGDQYER